MLLSALVFLASILTAAMFLSRQMLLGFPCLIFWAILGGHCYQESTATWDIYYFLFFGAMGMVIFSAVVMFALRTSRPDSTDEDEYIDEVNDTPSGTYIDEDSKPISNRRAKLRERAAERRNK